MAVGVGFFLARDPGLFEDIWRAGVGAVVCGMCGLIAWFVWLVIMLWLIFGVTEIRALPEDLTVRKRLLGLTWRRTIPNDELRRFQQIQDGGHDEDSFPSWGLEAVTERWRPVTLIFRQPHETSLWLGTLLSTYYEVELIAVPEE